MSTQSSLFRSFSFCTPLKPYSTTHRSFFPFQQHRISIRESSFLLLKLAAQSSSEIVLIETKEHHDGSLVFRFGDASEVVEKDNVGEEIEIQTEQESSNVKALEGDQDGQVITETDDSVEGTLVEVADGNRNADIGGDTAETETNGDYHAESSDTLSDISEEAVLVSQSDADLNDIIKAVESTLDEAKVSVELDEEESLDPTISPLDNTPNIEKSEDYEGTLLKGSNDMLVDPSVSVKLESTQASQTEVMDVEAEDTNKSDTENVFVEFESTQVLQTESMENLDKVGTEDRKSDTEDITPSAFPTTMPISDSELTDAANEDVEEEQKDTTVNEGTLVDDLPPSNPSDVRLMDAVNEDAKEELQDVNINEATIVDEMASSDQLIVEQPTLDEASQLQSVDVKDQTMEDEDVEEELQDMNINEATIIDEMSSSDQLVVEQPTLDEVSQLQTVHFKDQTMEDELQEVSTKNREENDVADLMPVSRVDKAEIVVEEEVSQPQSTPLELKPTIQVLDIDYQDTVGQDLDNGSLLNANEIKDPSVFVKLEAIQASDNEVMDVTQPYSKDESQMVENIDASEGDAVDLLPPATMHVTDVDVDEKLQDMNISEGNFTAEIPASDPLGAGSTLEVPSSESMDVKDVAVEDELQLVTNDVDTEEMLQDMSISEGSFINEIPASDPLGAESTLEVPSTKGMDVKDLAVENELQVVSNDVDTDERLQDMTISDGTFVDEIPASDSLGAESILEVSSTEGMDVKDLAVEGELQLVTSDANTDKKLQGINISGGDFINEIPAPNPLGAEPTLEVPSTKGLDVKDLAVEDELQLVRNDVDTDAKLQDMNISEGIFIDEIPASDLLGAGPTLEVSSTEGMDVRDLAVEDELELVSSNIDIDERLQDMSSGEGNFVDEIPTSDPLGSELTLKESSTEGMDVKDLAVKDELQLLSNDKITENEIADAMPAESILEEEVSQLHLTPVELQATMQVSDIKVQDATGHKPDDYSLQVINEDAGDGYIENVEQLPNQLESYLVQEDGVKDIMSEQCEESDAVESLIMTKEGAHVPLLEAERFEGMAGSSELAEASEVTTLLLAAEAEAQSREEIYLTDAFLVSGAALLEHPSKALTGGDDAYFVAGSKWLGVASGVSQWSFEGTGPGVYAQELMRTCEEIVLNANSISMTNPVELLCRGIKETNLSGSSNVLIANFNGQALHVANIGDTGFLIIRHGTVYKKSSPLLHEFHFAVQVDNSDDPLQLVEECVIELEVGDIVVSATDGLFDNLYEREITIIVSNSLQAGMKPQEIANILATRAHEVGKSSFVRSPFSDAAQAAGYTGYAGGKPDNVAVIVSLVEKRSDLVAE